MPLALGTLTAATFVLFVVLARLPVPSWDEWDWLAWLLTAPPSIERVFQPHNEHVIPIARLLYWLQYRLQGANGSLLVWTALVCQLGVGGIFWRQIQNAWPRDRALRNAALGGSLLTLFHAWQLHSIVTGASILFPLVLLLGTASISMGLASIDASGRSRLTWAAGSILAGVGAMLTTTNGVLVPLIVATLALMSRPGRSLAFAHSLFAIVGSVAYLMLVSGEPAGPSRLATAVHGLPTILGFFMALFSPFITYVSAPAGIVTGAVVIWASVMLSASVLTSWPKTSRIERFALGVMAFALASGLMAAVGRAQHFGIPYASQSRYGTYSMACWAALLLMTLGAMQRGAARTFFVTVAPLARSLALPASMVLLVLHGGSGVIWIAKADNFRGAGLAIAAGARDDAWIRTLHSSVDVVYNGRALAVAAGDRRLAGSDIGRHVEPPPRACEASLTLTAAPEGPALRVLGTAHVAAQTAWIIDPSGIVVGLAAEAPLVDQPNPSSAEIFAGLKRLVNTDTSSTGRRWIGFVPSSARQPFTFVTVQSDHGVCSAPLLPR